VDRHVSGKAFPEVIARRLAVEGSTKAGVPAIGVRPISQTVPTVTFEVHPRRLGMATSPPRLGGARQELEVIREPL
jgi:hypothetical protein